MSHRGSITARHRGRSGSSLIEVLISIVVIGLIVGGLTTGIVTLIRSTAQANDQARANVLVAGFGDMLKTLPYQTCEQVGGDLALLASLYDSEFAQVEGDVAADRRLLSNAGDSVSTTDVVVDCNPTDRGVQTITYEVTSRTATRTAQITKRDPDLEIALTPEFQANEGTYPGDPLVRFELDASASKPRARIVSYVYDCDVDDPANPELIVNDPIDAQAVCEYPAPSGAALDKRISLVLIDSYGQRSSPRVKPVTLPPVSNPRVADIRLTATCTSPTQSATVSASPCTANPSRTVNFDASGSGVSDGRIISYEWRFGDPNSGDANTLKNSSPTASYTYSRTGPFTVSLTAIDDVGGRYEFRPSATDPPGLLVYINRPGPPPPIASFTFSPIPAIATQTIAFDGRPSSGSGGASISTYSWEFIDPSNPSATRFSTEAQPRIAFALPGRYTARLTVTDTNARTSTASANVVIGSLLRPDDPAINFQLTRLKGCFLGFQLFGCRATATFVWNNGPASANDDLRYEMEIRYEGGVCFGFNTESKTVAAGAPGTPQTYVYTFRGASDVCPGSTYGWRVRTIRNSAEDGTFFSDYTNWRSIRAVS